MMKKILFVLALAASVTTVSAQTTPAKKEDCKKKDCCKKEKETHCSPSSKARAIIQSKPAAEKKS